MLEFVAAPGEGNLEDCIALLGEDAAETPVERDVSLRLLRHHELRCATSSITTPNS